ncbi:unnamed protein product [Caenorhabditis auriculariae]|uniref:Nas2 N-terminal domain-containing protein n=1 Tax=Caenorhabditis auriculariae TaxID=2777116 RepID=A0A8S1HSC8_9PELO|nr:unnamed protein product [Caenorhabditis auriculariae]
MASDKEMAKALMAERDATEKKINANFEILKANNSTMDSPLVDSENFPLNNIDIYAVRHARHDIICLKNDREEINQKLAQSLEIVHQIALEEKNNAMDTSTEAGVEKPVHRTSNDPFAKVSSVTKDSPAYVGGFEKDDLLIQYGTLHFGNFHEIQQVAQVTKASADKTLRVTVLRNDRPVRLEIRPRQWSGPGLLGCSIMQNQLKQYEHLVGGFCGGMASTLVCHPLDLLKIRFSANEGSSLRPQYSSYADAVRKITRAEGPRGLYQGLTPNLIGASLSWGLYFQWYHFIKKNIIDGLTGNEQIDNFFSGFLSGSAIMCITNPIWVAKTRLCLQYETSATKNYKGTVDCLRKILAEEGVRGLYRGFVPGIFGTTHGALQFATYNWLKDVRCRLRNQPKDSFLSHSDYLICSSMSKVFATTITFPYQLLRTRMQDHNIHSGGVWQTTLTAVRNEGISALWKGCLMANFRQLPAAVVTFWTYENVRRLINMGSEKS